MPPAHLNKILDVELDWLDEEVSIPNRRRATTMSWVSARGLGMGAADASTLAFLHQAAYRIV
jgi:hypothetical protein